VQCSTIVSARKRRPSSSASATKFTLQISFTERTICFGCRKLGRVFHHGRQWRKEMTQPDKADKRV
jgi:hypothetical protein